MAGRIVVVGSLNADLVVRCARAPAAGETVAGTSFASVPGNKRANQAVAAARAAARAVAAARAAARTVAAARAAAENGRPAAVALVGCVGRDDFGRELRASLRAAGVDDTLVRDVDHLIVNESEAAFLVGATELDTAADAGATIAALRRAGFARITLTLGAAGAIHCAGGRLRRAAVPRVAVVDTTAAGALPSLPAADAIERLAASIAVEDGGAAPNG